MIFTNAHVVKLPRFQQAHCPVFLAPARPPPLGLFNRILQNEKDGRESKSACLGFSLPGCNNRWSASFAFIHENAINHFCFWSLLTDPQNLIVQLHTPGFPTSPISPHTSLTHIYTPHRLLLTNQTTEYAAGIRRSSTKQTQSQPFNVQQPTCNTLTKTLDAQQLRLCMAPIQPLSIESNG